MRMNILDALKSSQSCLFTSHSRTSHRTHIPTHQYFIHNLLNPSRRLMEWMNILLRALESTDVRYRYFPEDGETRERDEYRKAIRINIKRWRNGFVCLVDSVVCFICQMAGMGGNKVGQMLLHGMRCICNAIDI